MQTLSTRQPEPPRNTKEEPKPPNTRKCCCQRDSQRPPADSRPGQKCDTQTPEVPWAGNAPDFLETGSAPSSHDAAFSMPYATESGRALSGRRGGEGVERGRLQSTGLQYLSPVVSVSFSRAPGRGCPRASLPREAVWIRGRSTLTCGHSAQNSSASCAMKQKSVSSVTRTKRGSRPKLYLSIVAVTLAFHSPESDRIPSTAQAIWWSTSQSTYLGL
ncbi:uncharacterized protein J3D65DRAFT_620332 [Phyllosticta citribraziliensis]|uniref:Uncharacterized protein n=1 Tax=Phyllosticta citribraziliensis TaxID=989973 RepID=A0ABR1LXP0_9PEZI